MSQEPQFRTIYTSISADYPVLAADASGHIWLAWTDLCQGQITVARDTGNQVSIEAPAVLGTAALAVEGERVIVGRREGTGEVVWTLLNKELKTEPLSRFPGTDPACCFDSQGSMRLFWCSPSGQVMSATENQKPHLIGGTRACRVGCVPIQQGKVFLVWDDATPDGRGILAAALDAAGNVVRGPECVTAGLRINWAPCIIADDNGRVFMAWENCRCNDIGRGFDHLGSEAILQQEDSEKMGGHGYRLERVILGAVLSDSTLRWLGGKFGQTPLPLALDAVKPSMLMDPDGNLWLAYQAMGSSRQWETWVRLLTTNPDSQPFRISSNGGYYSRRPALAGTDEGQLRIAVPHVEGQHKDRQRSIIYGALGKDGLPRGPSKPISRPVDLTVPEPLAKEKPYTTTIQDQSYSVYFGDLHMHSEISACSRHKDGDLREKYEFARDVAERDFAAITDHSREFTEYDWQLLKEVAKAYYAPGSFVPFLALELISRAPGLFFHRQIIYRDPESPLIFRDNDPRIQRNADIWRLMGDRPIIAILHQPGDRGMEGVYEDHDPRYQPLVEVYQLRGSYEKWEGPHWVFEHRFKHYAGAYDSPGTRQRTRPEEWLNRELFVQSALAKGSIFGFSGGGEHEGSGITGVYAEDLTREAIFNALKARRCFASTGAKIILDVRLSGHPMGSIVTDPGEVRLQIKVKGTAPLTGITIVKDNVDVPEIPVEGGQTEFQLEWLDEGAPSASDWKAPHHSYYVRARQADDQMVWSSPIFVKTC